MMYDLEAAHNFSSDNKAQLESEQKCGCFYCRKIFSSSDIKNWINEGTIGTALCPYCGIDAVIGENSGYVITDDFLHKMHLHWFESGVGNQLSTSFGSIKLTLDEKAKSFGFFAVSPEKPFAEVNGIYKIEYDYKTDGKEHEIKLLLDNPECNARYDTGERFDAITSDIGEGRITIAFIEPETLDLQIEFIENGIILRSSAATESQTLKFGVCWIDKLPSADDNQTWLGADVK